MTAVKEQAEVRSTASTETAPARTRLTDSITFWKGAALFGAIAMANTVWWMGAYNYRTLTVDDVALFVESNTPGGYASTLASTVFDSSYDKWRPIPAAMLAVTTDLFGSEYMNYKLFNLFLVTVVCTLVAILVFRITGGNWLLAAGAGLAVTVSRFNSYFVLQAIGMMESTALAFALLTAIALSWAYTSGRRAGLVLANAAFFCATISHERYLFLFPFVFLATAWAPIGFRSVRDRATWAAVPAGVAAFNYAFKSWVLGIDFSTGAGGQELELDAGQIAEFVRSAFLNTVGYNTGPSFLSGRDAAVIGSTAVWLSVAFAVPAAVLILLAIANRPARTVPRIDVLRPYALGLALYVPLLLSASITFRQEFRWLYVPFCFLVVGLAWAVARLPRRGVAIVMGMIVLAASLTVDTYYRQYLGGTYFIRSQRAADSVAELIIDQYERELRTSSFVVVTGQPPNGQFERGTLKRGRFFEVYAPGSGIDVRLVETLDDTAGLEDLRPVVHFFRYRERAQSIFPIDGPASSES